MADDVTFQRLDYQAALPDWILCADTVSGARAVKSRQTMYLPQPNPTDKSVENANRYKQYVERAVFASITRRTLYGLLGMLYRKPPVVELPTGLSYALENVDSGGVGIVQQSIRTSEDVLKFGRCGLLVDFPETDGQVSRAAVASGIRPYIRQVDPRNVTNWRTSQMNGQSVLSLVVIYETTEEAGQFATVAIDQYRVLELVGGVYTVSLWRKDEQSNDWYLHSQRVPTASNGIPLDFIPFVFTGSTNNDPEIDPVPLLPIAELNIAHYRNSADYEDSVYIIGQPQAYIAGLDENWRKWLEEAGIYFGARAPFLLPEGGTAGILQAAPNSLAKEAMDQKEALMIQLGAMLMTQGTVAKTATQAGAEEAVQHSVLSLVAENVSKAYTQCIEWMGVFAGTTGGMFTINDDFIRVELTPQMLTALIQAWQSGKLPDSDLWANLRKYGVIDSEKTDETIKDELSTTGAGLNLDGQGSTLG